MKNKIYRLALSGELIAPVNDLEGSYNSANDLLDELEELELELLLGV